MIRCSPLFFAASLVPGCSLLYVDTPCDTATTEVSGNWAAVASGVAHVCALDTDGFATCAIAAGSPVDVTVEPSTAFDQIVSGYNFSCGRTSDGYVTCWGTDIDTYELTAPATTFADIAAGSRYVCGITAETREVLCWGSGDYGQTGGTTEAGVIALATGAYQACAVYTPDAADTADTGSADTTAVTCWGTPPAGFDFGQGTPPFSLTDPRKIAASTTLTCTLNDAGTPTCWGFGASAWSLPQYTFQTLDLGDKDACGITQGGRAVCLGVLSTGIPSNLLQVSVSSTEAFACGVDALNQIQCWGGASFDFATN